MKIHSDPCVTPGASTVNTSPRAVTRLGWVLLLLCCALAAVPEARADQSWLSGVNVINFVTGGPADNDVVDNATLIVTNGGSLTASQMNVGPNNPATLTLLTNAAINLQTLLATNVVLNGPINSSFNLNGGTLTTSNAVNAVAASILVASNTAFNINGNWNMNGGTHTIATVQPNGTFSSVRIGSSANNVTINVNSNAVWSLGTAATNLSLYLGYGAVTNNQLWVNNGTLTHVNTGSALSIGNNAASGKNQLVITNGGQVFCSLPGNSSGSPSATVGNNGANNSAIVVGTNSAGLPATWNLGGSRFYVGNGGTSNNWVQVDQGGVITNIVSIWSWGVSNALVITNGGQVFALGATIGRGAFGDSLALGGTDGAGHPATLNMLGGFYSLNLAGSTAGTNNWVRVGQGGYITSGGQMVVGANAGSVSNYMVITNGGQVVAQNGGVIGSAAGANNNWLAVGGSFGTTNATFDLSYHSLTIGGIATATNNSVTVSSGGLLKGASTVILGGVNSTLYFNGGTLSAQGNVNLIATNATTVNATVLVQGGGASINDNGSVITNQLPLTHDSALGAAADGGLTKLGGGTLVLSRASTYTGPTTNNAGTLKAGVAWVPGTGGAFGNNSPVILSNRAGVVLDITGFNTQIGSLTGGGAAGGNVTLGAATLTIGGDNSNPAAYAGIISDSGAVTKIGSGTLTLAGANTYSGATAVNAGALIGVTGGSCAGSIITVAAGATNGVQLLTDGGQWTCAGLINNSGGYLDFNMADTTAAPLQVNGNLGLSSSLKIIVRGAVSGAAGTHYPLIAYTGNLSGSVPGAALSLPVGMSGYITNNNITANGTIDLVLTANYTVAASTLYWAAGGGNWDIGTTLGWKNTAAPGAPNVFYPDNVPVVLDDSASGASPIVVTATTTVSPTSVTANLTNKNYVLSGGMIAGGGALTKNGPGTLTLLGGESYTGITAINGGTLQLGDGTANNCDLAGDITNNAALVFAAPYPQDFSHVISGSGAVTKSGAGTVTLYGANTYAGNTAINAGGLMVGGGGAINSPAAMLNIGDVAGTSGTATLGDGGVIAVRTLLATNGVIGGAVNSHFNFTGGSLTTSNSPGAAAATILLPANTAFNIDGNWMMNGGVHTIATVQTNGSYYGTVNVGHLANNVTVGVNAGAVWSLGSAITNIGLCVGNGPTANDALWVNNGSLFVTNAGYTPLVIGNNADSQGNQLVITNGGQVVCGTLYGANSASVGNNGNNNSATVAGTNAAGLKATWNLGASRLYIGTGATTTGNWVQVGPGGVITNVSNSGIISWGTNSSLIITNGGQVFTAGATVGRGATDNSFMVAGTDSAGNPATLNMEGGLNNLQIGIFGTSNPGNNNKVWLGQGGLVTNVASVLLGGVDSALYLNGGTLAAGNTGNLMATNSTTVNATVFVQSGGAVINTAGYTVASQLPLTEDPGSTGGGLTKLGSGTLTLLAANTYTGNTTVSNGTLSIQQPTLVSGSTVVVAGGAVLDLGFAGTNTVASLILSGSVMPGGVYNSNLTSQITGPGSLLVSGGGGTINPNPPQLQVSCSGGNLSLGWPNNLGWILQSNSVSPAAPGAWHNYPADGSVSVTSVSIPVNKGVTNVFFRMLKP